MSSSIFSHGIYPDQLPPRKQGYSIWVKKLRRILGGAAECGGIRTGYATWRIGGGSDGIRGGAGMGCGSGTIRNLEQLFFFEKKLKINESEPVLQLLHLYYAV